MSFSQSITASELLAFTIRALLLLSAVEGDPWGDLWVMGVLLTCWCNSWQQLGAPESHTHPVCEAQVRGEPTGTLLGHLSFCCTTLARRQLLHPRIGSRNVLLLITLRYHRTKRRMSLQRWSELLQWQQPHVNSLVHLQLIHTPSQLQQTVKLWRISANVCNLQPVSNRNCYTSMQV